MLPKADLDVHENDEGATIPRPEDCASRDLSYETDNDNDNDNDNGKTKALHRDRYFGALTFNIAAFLLPALYSTLSKL
jgi:Na+-driven multidrug efflux pump